MGSLDHAVNNAGIERHQLASDYTLQDWEDMRWVCGEDENERAHM